jgi:hypothetical protein
MAGLARNQTLPLVSQMGGKRRSASRATLRQIHDYRTDDKHTSNRIEQ